MKEQPSYYSMIPASVRYDDRISDFAKVLFSEITALSNKYGYCFATNSQLASLYNKNPTWISEVITSLEVAGHIKSTVAKDNKRKIYIVTPLRLKQKTSSGKAEDPSSGKAEHNSTSSNIQTNNIAEPPAPPVFSFQEYLKKMQTDKRSSIRFIAYYLKVRNLTFDSEDQVKVAIKRHIRAATDVVKFGDAAVREAVSKCKEMGEKDNIAWTIETVLKMLTK